MAYGAEPLDLAEASGYLDRQNPAKAQSRQIFRRASVEIELVINLKTAKALDITIPAVVARPRRRGDRIARRRCRSSALSDGSQFDSRSSLLVA